MAKVRIIFYAEQSGKVPTLEFLDAVPLKAKHKLDARLSQLELFGNELRRPLCEHLGQGIYELRTRHIKVQYRLLYFFYGQEAVVVSHGFTKEGKIPFQEIRRAIQRKQDFYTDPQRHSFIRGLRML